MRPVLLASGNTMDEGRWKDVWEKINSLLLQESLKKKKKLPIYAQLEPLTISIPCRGSLFGREDSKASEYENTSTKDRSMQAHLKNPPFENSILYDFIYSYEKDEITKLLDTIATIINSMEDQDASTAKRSHRLAEKGLLDANKY